MTTFLKAIIATFDIESYLNDRGIPFAERGNNISRGWIGINCVFPGCTDRSNHLGIRLSDKKIHCWKCGTHGDIRNLISTIDGISDWKEVRDIVRRYQTFEYWPEERLPLPENKEIDLSEIQPLTKDGTPKAWQYLVGRGYDPQYLIDTYGIRYGRIGGYFQYRIVIPVFKDKKIVNLVGRDITNQSSTRYLFLPIEESKIPRNQLVYNLDNVGDTMVITEGCFDSWMFGVEYGVSTFGTSVSPEQRTAIIKKKPKKVVIMFDEGEEALKRAKELSLYLALQIPVVQVAELEGCDPATLRNEDVRIFLKNL